MHESVRARSAADRDQRVSASALPSNRGNLAWACTDTLAPSIPQVRLQNASDRAPDGHSGSRIPSFSTCRSGGWPLSSFLELGALDGAAPSARLHALHLAREWGLASRADDTQLVVSELVTNAVRASRSMAHASIGLWLASDQSQVAITVWDASLDPPERVEASQDAESGRGLLLVEEVSAQWGWYAPLGQDHTPGAGKLVWAIVS